MKEGCRRQRREARDKMEKGGGRKAGVTSVVSRAGEDSSGHAAWGECME